MNGKVFIQADFVMLSAHLFPVRCAPQSDRLTAGVIALDMLASAWDV
jgi:hypothetical protein